MYQRDGRPRGSALAHSPPAKTRDCTSVRACSLALACSMGEPEHSPPDQTRDRASALEDGSSRAHRSSKSVAGDTLAKASSTKDIIAASSAHSQVKARTYSLEGLRANQLDGIGVRRVPHV